MTSHCARKRILVICDGMADTHCAGRSGAFCHEMPRLDSLRAEYGSWRMLTVPDGCDVTSDNAILTILGYHTDGHTVRGALEALGAGISLGEEETAWRCHLDNTLTLPTDARGLNSLYGSATEKFYDTPRPDTFIFVTKDVVKPGKPGMSFIWGSRHENYPPFPGGGAVIAGASAVKGIGRAIGMEVPDIKGVTGWLDTDYSAKAREAGEALKKHDFVLIHIEAPDEASHRRDPEAKARALRSIDSHIIGPLLRDFHDAHMAVMADHATSPLTGEHIRGPVEIIANYPLAKAGHCFGPDNEFITSLLQS